jgi:hypothetical protein
MLRGRKRVFVDSNRKRTIRKVSNEQNLGKFAPAQSQAKRNGRDCRGDAGEKSGERDDALYLTALSLQIIHA